jgi:putative transposase
MNVPMNTPQLIAGQPPSINNLTFAQRLRFAKGDTIFLPLAEAGKRCLLTVTKSTRTGYMLLHNETGERRNWSNEELFDHYSNGQLEHFQANVAGLDEALQELLEADFSSWPANLQLAARWRELFCLELDRQLEDGLKLPDARLGAIGLVYSANAANWETKAAIAESLRGPKLRSNPKKSAPILSNASTPKFSEPSVSTLRDWHARWKAAGRDIRALIPQYHRRGDRQDRYPNLVHLQNHPDKPKCIYGAMQNICTKIYLKIPRVSKKYAYKKLAELCAAHAIKCISEKGFRDYIKRRYNDYAEFRARYGGKAAWYKFHIFDRRHVPDIPLAEVEIDHTLIDIVVMNEMGVAHRPWLTLLLDRCTRAIVGFHIGFDHPSHATVQRALVHAISIKDLTGIEGIENAWPCHGVMDFIITDRGLEFLGESLAQSCRDLGISIINLRGRCPELKGSVERFFGTLNTKVFDISEGSTKSRTLQYYEPYAKAKYTLSELTLKIVKWIVDEYHTAAHPLTGEPPLDRWNRLVAQHGVRGVNNFQRLMILTGETVKRKISNVGIEFEYNLYKSEALENLRCRRGGLKKDWTIRIDPYNRAEIHVLDEENRTFLTVPAVNPGNAKGNKFACRVYRRMARTLAPNGAPITETIWQEAMKRCDSEAKTSRTKQAGRFIDAGALATPLVSMAPSTLTLLKPTKPVVSESKTTMPIADPVLRETPKDTKKFSALLDELLAQSLA